MRYPPCDEGALREASSAPLAKKSTFVAAAASLKEFFTTRKDALLTEISTKAALDKDLEAKLQAACDEWKAGYTS